MPAPILSVCIPTYNRGACLQRCLTQLCRQIVAGGLQQTVQICVSDNASDDGTSRVIHDIRAAFPTVVFKCRRQLENLGFARNALEVVRLADGEYASFCGDDDIFRDNGLAILLEGVKSGYDIILLGTEHGVGEYTLSRDQNPLRVDSPLAANRQLGVFQFSFIGSLLFRPGLYLQYHREEFFDSVYPHVAVIATALWRHPGLYLPQRHLVRSGDERRDWQHSQPLYAAIDLARIQTTCFLTRGARRSDIWLVYRQLVRSIPRMVLNQRLGLIRIREPSPFSATNAGNLLACYRRSWLFQAVALMLWVLAHALPLIVLRRLLKSARADG